MKYTKRLIKTYLWLVIFVSIAFISFKVPGWVNLYKGKQAIAVGGFPMQFGLTSVVTSPCMCIPPFCTGCMGAGALCVAAIPPCSTYTDVKGTPAGGMGSNILMMTKSVAAIGLSSGGEVMCGAASPVMMSACASIGGLNIGP